MRLSIRLNLSLVLGVALVSLAFALYQTQSETYGLRRDLDRQAAVLAESLERAATPLVAGGATRELQRLVDRFQDHERLAGVAVYDSEGRPLAATSNLPAQMKNLPPSAVEHAVKEGTSGGEYFAAGGNSLHVYALPLQNDAGPLGALAIFHNTGYIEQQSAATLHRALASVVVQTMLIVCVTLLVLRWGLGRPIETLAAWLGDLRMGRASGAGPQLPEEDVFVPLKREAARLATSISVARAAAEQEARLRYTGESLWTAERLRVAVSSKLDGSRLFAISNREPCEHFWRGNTIESTVPASGLVTALEPVLRACDGTWIAQGTGTADRETVDEHDRLRVPPEHPEYTLRRVWVSEEEERGFYFGFSNEGLWPLCHIAHTRPVFREQDWRAYSEVNRRFADALLEEVAGEKNPVVLVQDYHFALAPRMIKDARPDARVAIFWHIPWPNPEAFSICPWQRELLDGLLGADLLGFHLQSHCNNFLESVDRALESRTDREHFSVKRGGHLTYVRPFPISVDFEKAGAGEDAGSGEDTEGSIHLKRAELLREIGAGSATLMGIGVDRVDYTKGLPERLLALERFFGKYPGYRGQFTFVQIGAPSRTHIRRYQELMDDVKSEAERINKRFQTAEWRPIVFLAEHHSHKEIQPFYRTSDLCLVTSLHDGMNLVAKEFVAAQSSEQGVLVLSRFAGASHELVDALVVNPYDTEELAESIHRALEMAPEERRARISRMRTYVREHNIYRWAGNLIAELAAIRVEEGAMPEPDTRAKDRPGGAEVADMEHVAASVR